MLLARAKADVEQPLGPFAKASQWDRASIALKFDNGPSTGSQSTR